VKRSSKLINKVVENVEEAISGIQSGFTVLIGGFGDSGIPIHLLEAVLRNGAKDLTIVTNNAGSGDSGVAALLKARRVKKIVTSYPRSRGSVWFERLYKAGEIELELVPQGSLSERIRAGGGGIGAFYTPTGAGTLLGHGKEERVIDGVSHILEFALKGDISLISARFADRWGNLTYHATARNLGPSMAMASTLTVVEVKKVVELGELSPEIIITPGIFVDRVVKVKNDFCTIHA
jgi:3-oxoadipate CoA-transferase alpha subunit